jgi:hypothetical protein
VGLVTTAGIRFLYSEPASLGMYRLKFIERLRNMPTRGCLGYLAGLDIQRHTPPIGPFSVLVPDSGFSTGNTASQFQAARNFVSGIGLVRLEPPHFIRDHTVAP